MKRFVTLGGNVISFGDKFDEDDELMVYVGEDKWLSRKTVTELRDHLDEALGDKAKQEPEIPPMPKDAIKVLLVDEQGFEIRAYEPRCTAKSWKCVIPLMRELVSWEEVFEYARDNDLHIEVIRETKERIK